MLDVILDASPRYKARALLLHLDRVEFDATRAISLLNFDVLKPINRLLLHFKWELLINVVALAMVATLSSTLAASGGFAASLTLDTDVIIVIKGERLGLCYGSLPDTVRNSVCRIMLLDQL